MLLSVESFITEEERLELLCEAFSASEQDWYSESTKPEEYWVGKRLPFVSNTTRSLDERLTQYFQDYSSISLFRSIQRIPVNEYMGEHIDRHHSTNEYGCVAYINDDYEGGELIYPRLNIVVKPKAGMLVIHSSDEPHMINTVRNKVRYMITCFVHSGNGCMPRVVGAE